MMSVKDGEVKFHGDVPKLFIDLVVLLHGFMGCVGEEIGREDAEKLLVLAGRFAVLDSDELDEKFEEIVEEFQNDTRL
jgi:hypothetical protein